MKARMTVFTGIFDGFVFTEDYALGHDYRFPFHFYELNKAEQKENKQKTLID